LLSQRLMLLEIVCNGETTPVDLADGTVKLGGGPNDDIVIAGLPHGLLTLDIEVERVTVTSIRSVRIGAALFPARVPRMLVDGEELKLPNDVIVRRALDQAKRASRKTVGTAFFAKELLAGDFAVEHTRAATLTCVAGVDQGNAFPVAFAESVIGRADEADIRVRDRAASRRHATLTREGKAWFVTDLSATNGVFLNGVRVARSPAGELR
jgi:Inner membrane component of T3SS, cytoplasmic domain